MLWAQTYWTADQPGSADYWLAPTAYPSGTGMTAWRDPHEPCDWHWPSDRWKPGVVYVGRYQQAALGMSNRQIAEQLEIAEQTVKNHLSSAMRKLSPRDRTHAVVVALSQGWIPLPSPKALSMREADLVLGHGSDQAGPIKD